MQKLIIDALVSTVQETKAVFKKESKIKALVLDSRLLEPNTKDILESFGIELTYDTPEKRVKYHFILDLGSGQRVPNPSAHYRKLQYSIEEGGFYLYFSSLSNINEGYQTLQPRFFIEWFTINGFSSRGVVLILDDGQTAHIKGDTKAPFKVPSKEVGLFAVFKKVDRVKKEEVLSW